MKGTEVQLTEMLLCREHRTLTQNIFLEKYQCPVISFCMNIPGPIKTNDPIRSAFEWGKSVLLDTLSAHHAEILQTQETHESTGDELIMAIQLPAQTLKTITMQIEEQHPLGRLFDMDVIDQQGNKLSRPQYRKCLVCSRQAQACARTRAHGIKEMQDVIDTMLKQELALYQSSHA